MTLEYSLVLTGQLPNLCTACADSSFTSLQHTTELDILFIQNS